MTRFAIATEDALSEAVAETLLAQAGIGEVHARIRRSGFGYLKSRIKELNCMADRVMPVLLLTDLDRYQCPPGMIAEWLPAGRAHRLLFRIAVRETESWLLADHSALARFIGISTAAIPARPDELPDPKAKLLKLVRQSSNRALRRDVLPTKGSTSPLGLGYNDQFCRFVRTDWSSERAAESSASLRKTVSRIREAQASAFDL
jgi:hypothetical protein